MIIDRLNMPKKLRLSRGLTQNRGSSWCQLCRHWRPSGGRRNDHLRRHQWRQICIVTVPMMSTLSSVGTPWVVVKTTYGAASNDKVGIMTTLFWEFDLGIQWTLEMPQPSWPLFVKMHAPDTSLLACEDQIKVLLFLSVQQYTKQRVISICRDSMPYIIRCQSSLFYVSFNVWQATIKAVGLFSCTLWQIPLFQFCPRCMGIC